MITYDSPVVLSFVILSFFALLLNTITGGGANRVLFSVYRSSLFHPLTYVRLFTHVIGHCSFSHYIGNMMLFLLLGPAVERTYGSAALLLMIAVTAAVTGLVHMLLSAHTSLSGASGIVFMLITLTSLSNYEEGQIPLTFLFVVVLYLGEELYEAFSGPREVSELTHLIGAVLGIVFALIMRGVIRVPLLQWG